VRRREFLLAAVAAAPVLVGRPAAAGAGRAPLALATADTEGFVAVVDLAAGRRVGTVATLDGPRSIEARGRGPVVPPKLTVFADRALLHVQWRRWRRSGVSGAVRSV